MAEDECANARKYPDPIGIEKQLLNPFNFLIRQLSGGYPKQENAQANEHQ